MKFGTIPKAYQGRIFDFCPSFHVTLAVSRSLPPVSYGTNLLQLGCAVSYHIHCYPRQPNPAISSVKFWFCDLKKSHSCIDLRFLTYFPSKFVRVSLVWVTWRTKNGDLLS